MREDLAFWVDVLSHPQVSHVLDGHDPESISVILDRPGVITHASKNGGLIFVPSDSLKLAYEMHTMFKPEGWGKEVFHTARKAFDSMFEYCDLIFTYETDHPQSRPPRTFRFAPASEFRNGRRIWTLTRNAWLASPARSH